VTVLLPDLPAGHVFEPLTFSVDAARSRAYRQAVGDSLAVYDEQGAVPPLAVAALALGALLERVSLPEGTLHANESLQVHEAVPDGAELECSAQIVQRSVRGGRVVSVLLSEIKLDGRPAVTTRATVIGPAAS
jgi:hypothetical protein